MTRLTPAEAIISLELAIAETLASQTSNAHKVMWVNIYRKRIEELNFFPQGRYRAYHGMFGHAVEDLKTHSICEECRSDLDADARADILNAEWIEDLAE